MSSKKPGQGGHQQKKASKAAKPVKRPNRFGGSHVPLTLPPVIIQRAPKRNPGS